MRSFTDPPGLKNSAFASTGVRSPCVTRFSRTRGVQPIVSRMFAYGLVCGGTGVRPRRGGLRLRARRVRSRAVGVGLRAPGGSGGGDGGGGRRGEDGPPRGGAVGRALHDGAARRRVAKLDRLQERRRDRQPVPPPWGEPQLPRPRERRGVERRIAARDRKSTRLNSSHITISYAVFCLKKKKQERKNQANEEEHIRKRKN